MYQPDGDKVASPGAAVVARPVPRTFCQDKLIAGVTVGLDQAGYLHGAGAAVSLVCLACNTGRQFCYLKNILNPLTTTSENAM
jgi:hypothetical protein